MNLIHFAGIKEQNRLVGTMEYSSINLSQVKGGRRQSLGAADAGSGEEYFIEIEFFQFVYHLGAIAVMKSVTNRSSKDRKMITCPALQKAYHVQVIGKNK